MYNKIPKGKTLQERNYIVLNLIRTNVSVGGENSQSRAEWSSSTWDGAEIFTGKHVQKRHLWSLREGSFCVLCAFSWHDQKIPLTFRYILVGVPMGRDLDRRVKFKFWLLISLMVMKNLWKLSLHIIKVSPILFACLIITCWYEGNESLCYDFDMSVLLALKATGLIKKLDNTLALLNTKLDGSMAFTFRGENFWRNRFFLSVIEQSSLANGWYHWCWYAFCARCWIFCAKQNLEEEIA